MRIGFDMSFMASSRMGTGVYAETVLRKMMQQMGMEDAVVGFTEDANMRFPALQPSQNLRVVRVTPGNPDSSIEYRHLLWDSALSLACLDVYFSPAGIAPRIKACPVAITIHDLLFEHRPEFYSPALLDFLKKEIRRSADAADAVIAISDHTKDDIVRTYGVDPEKIIVLRQGLRNAFDRAPTRAAMERAAAILPSNKPYILTLSNHAPHKNTAFAVEVFARWLKLSHDTECVLIVAGGGPAPQAPIDIEAAAARHGLLKRVVVTGGIDEALLPALYAGARCFLYPSLYEGWGLPPLEAIAMGTPAIVSDRGGLPEAVGQAALVLGLEDPAPWAEALQLILSEGPSAKLQAAMLKRKEEIMDIDGRRILETLKAAQSRYGRLRRSPLECSASVLIRADWNSPSGLATAARATGAALERQGVHVFRQMAARDCMTDPEIGLPGLPAAGDGEKAPVVIHHCSPDDIRRQPEKYNIGVIFWETDLLPGGGITNDRYNFIKTLNELDEIWASSSCMIDVLSKSRVKTPSVVVGYPLDTDFFSPGPRRMPLSSLPSDFDSTWTLFVYAGTWDIRKRPDDVILAFLNTFKPEEPVLLAVKTYGIDHSSLRDRVAQSLGLSNEDFRRIVFDTQIWPREKLRDLYRCAHVFVTATRGEGFGLCAVEAMACGAPVISTRFSAMKDYVNESTGYPIPHELRPLPQDCIFPWYQPNQRWGEPDVKAMGDAMRRVHQNRLEARKKGEHARQLVVGKCHPARVGELMRKRLAAILKERANSVLG